MSGVAQRAVDTLPQLKGYHALSVVDAYTGERVERLEAELPEGTWPHWRKFIKRGTVVLAASPDLAGDIEATTTVRVRFPDSSQIVRYFPDHDPAAGVPFVDYELTLTEDEPKTTALLAPRARRLVVEVIDSEGKPLSGQAVSVAPKGEGDERTALAEFAEPRPGGDPVPVYRSGEVQWGPEYHPARLYVGDALMRTAVIDPSARETRVQLIHT